MEETSLESYKEINEKTQGQRHQEILNALRSFQEAGEDATDYELTIFLEQTDPNYVRPRRHELVNRFKLIGFSQKRICRVSGKMALAWKLLKQRFN